MDSLLLFSSYQISLGPLKSKRKKNQSGDERFSNEIFFETTANAQCLGAERTAS
jgi:hypothetical protein